MLSFYFPDRIPRLSAVFTELSGLDKSRIALEGAPKLLLSYARDTQVERLER
jgi:hypothetical protein